MGLFGTLQFRSFGKPISGMRHSPSMDLIAVASDAESLSIHRSEESGFQRLFSVAKDAVEEAAGRRKKYTMVRRRDFCMRMAPGQQGTGDWVGQRHRVHL